MILPEGFLRLTIDKLIYGGDGLSRLPADGKRSQAVFVPFVLPGEEVEASVGQEKRGFSRAGLKEVVTASPHRVKPECRYFQQCGGCHYQHADYPHQLEIKTAILRETLLRTAKLEWPGDIHVHSAAPWHYRNRTRVHVHNTPSFALGYHASNSRRLVPVEECPISSSLINRALAQLWIGGRAGKLPAIVREVELFASHDDAWLTAELFLAKPPAKSEEAALNSWAEVFRASLPEMIGAAAFVIEAIPSPAAKAAWNFGDEALAYSSLGSQFRVSAGGFFQTNRFLLDELVQTAANGAEGGLAWDLYAGVGLFSADLAKRFKRVVAVESAPAAVRDLKQNLPANGKAVRATIEEFLSKAGGDDTPDFVLADPPRAGLGPEVVRHLVRLAPAQLACVSCDPATFARDLRGLLDGGYRLESLHLVDMFPQTYHLETVAHLRR